MVEAPNVSILKRLLLEATLDGHLRRYLNKYLQAISVRESLITPMTSLGSSKSASGSASGIANAESWFKYPIRVQPHHAEWVTCLTGQVTLVTVDVARRRVMRRMPEEIQAIVAKVASFSVNESSV